ncbi:hypothetical protein E4S40_07270 [Algoriphagus kandeliae]|uniref:alpha-L-rhamnosidase n=1 Tax=Algoriphagus kandeliae TaxID=2562278 RepID=A0A4Y9QU43_9BACT|nr:family 78 glycoside hydrolase catalytic domain [Algoriphagus kandeliae]TFV96019.1 hypothetical protein E4S40_07270 [Algoriphagus kandeliae]
MKNLIQYLKASLVVILITIGCSQKESNLPLSPIELTTEFLENPPVIDVEKPRLSWINSANEGQRGQRQTAYQIQVASTKELLESGKPDVWDSDKVSSEESYLVIYNGPKLESTETYYWRVKVWNLQDVPSEWSSIAHWGMGLLDSSEWQAKWIGAPWQGEEPLPDPVNPRASLSNDQFDVKSSLPPPAPLLRKEFTIEKEVAEAKALVTGLGYFEFYLNGAKVGEDVLIPNQTDYGHREGIETDRVPIENNFTRYKVMYLSYDITDQLQQGNNAMGAILGNGFYNAPKTWTASYGTPRFLGQIYIKYTDGSEEILISDESWKAHKSPIISDLIYEGEHYDARLEQEGWSSPGFDDSEWENVALRKAPGGDLVAHMAEPDRVMEVFEPLQITEVNEGHYVVDFGEEITGWVRLSNLNGESGEKISIRYISNDSTSETTGSNSYIMNGSGDESYATRFSWYVFRYAELTNWPGELTADQLTAEAVYTNIETTGEFETSNELFNKINEIWWRSQTDNMHGGIASDCPNRERSPYTGDGQVACVTVMHNFDAKAFYRKWIDDIVASQNPETGYVPNGAPWQPGCGGGPAWGAAINIMPWEYYLHYGDRQMLENTYEGMKGYLNYMKEWTDQNGVMYSQRTGHTDEPFRWVNLGDWAQPFDLPPDALVHTFYLWRCADFTAKAARALGYNEEAIEFEALAEQTMQGFYGEFYDEEKGTYGPNGGNIFALTMGVPEDQEPRVINALKEDIAARDGHLDTGIFGTQFFFEVLADYGMNDLAYEAMNKTTQPSFGWWVENGNTTSWEHWFRPGSGNHPMFGGGLSWFYRKLAGMNVDIENPGYKHIIFKPQPIEDMEYVSYSNVTPYGEAGIHWEEVNGKFSMKVTVPVGSTATVHVPFSDPSKIMESGSQITNDENISFEGTEEDYSIYKVNSGVYTFSFDS